MSNYLSQPIKYAAPPTDANFELLSKVALAQQQKYDVNHQQIQQTLDQFGALRTLRPEDDAYIAAKLNSITTQLNSAGGNLASQSLTDSFMGKIKGVAQDPFILNAIEQTKKKATVDAQVAELKKKDPNLVNDKNYKDMLDLAGYADYMAGKADKLGNMTYNPYVDITTSLHKKAADYSKERGLKDEYLGTENGTFETVDKFGNKVTEREIQQYLYSNLTDSEKTQMQINARSDYKYMPQGDFDKLILDDTKEQTTLLKDGLAKLKAEQASKSESDRVQYTDMIAETQRKITENENKIAKGTFDKSEMYNYYAKNTINGIAANYDIDRVTKIDRSDLPFQIMKFEKETMLKEAELALKKTEMEQSQAAAYGTATTIPTETEELQDTGLNVVRKDLHRADAALDAYLKQNNLDYAKMSPSEQWTYKVNLKLNKPTVAGANVQLKALVDNFSAAQTNYASIINNAKPQIAKLVGDNYNNLIGGKDLNLNNLATTMPLTAGLLKGGRTFDSLSKEEQLGVVSEFAANNLQYNNNLEGDVKTVYERVIDANNAELDKLGSPRAKQVRQAISKSASSEQVRNPIVAGLHAIGANMVNVPGGILNRAISSASYDINELFGGQEYAQAQKKAWDKSFDEMMGYSLSRMKETGRGLRDVFGGEDTNITELESRDLRARQGKASVDVADSFNALNSVLKAQIEKSTGGLMENQKETKAFTFSLDDKAQKGTALALRAAIQANGGAVDESIKDFTVSRSGTQFKITHADKKGESLVTVTVPSLPAAVTNVVDVSTQSWNNNPNNPNIKISADPIRQYADPTVRSNEMKAMLENIPSLTREQRIAILTNPSNTAFATIPEVRDKVKQVYSNAFYEKNRTQIESILNTVYQPVPYAEGGAFYLNMKYIDENGEPRIQYLPNPIGATKDEYSFFLQYNEAMAKIRDMRIKALTNR